VATLVVAARVLVMAAKAAGVEAQAVPKAGAVKLVAGPALLEKFLAVAGPMRRHRNS
jgi:hypothetical protein